MSDSQDYLTYTVPLGTVFNRSLFQNLKETTVIRYNGRPHLQSSKKRKKKSEEQTLMIPNLCEEKILILQKDAEKDLNKQ